LLIQRTPAHPEERFQHSIWFQHFSQLSLVLSRDFLRVLALQIAFYWFVANFLGLVFIAFGKELFPDALEGGAAGAGSEMMLYVGIGLMIGSSIVSIISAKRIRPELIPLGAIGMALGLIGVCFLTPLSIGSKGCLAFVGFFSGFFVVPLASLLQNRAPEEERGRILAVSNLLNSLSGIIAIGLSFGLSALKLSASLQTWAVIAPLIIAFFLALPYLRQREPTDGGPTTAA
ncbi:MAG: MFS transporter, partial [Verrucomicrobiota bacterium]